MASRRCRDCHSDTVISSRSIHVALLRKEKSGEAIICVNCHSAHMISRTGAGPVAKSEDKYCLRCHSSEGRKSFINGETISTQVNAAEILGSPIKISDAPIVILAFLLGITPITGSGPSGNTGMLLRRYAGDVITISIRR